MNAIVFFGISLFLLVVLLRTIKIVPQKQVKIIERLGKFHRTAEAGLNTVLPFLDSVRATIDLSHSLGLEVVAEGVEDEAILRLLVEMGSNRVQGYHIARPMPPTELIRWCQSHLAHRAEFRPLAA